MRILFFKILIPTVMLATLYEPFVGLLFFMGTTFVRLEALTWGLMDTRTALITAIVTLMSWLVHRRSPRQRAERYPVQFWLFLMVVAAMTLTTLTAEASVEQSWLSVQKFYKYLIFQILMINLINNRVRFRLVQEVFFWGVSFLVVWGIDQYFRGNIRLENIGGGDFADSSALCALFLLMFPMVVYRVLHTNRWVRLSGLLFAPAYAVAIVFTQSRSGFLGALVMVFLLFLRTKRRLRTIFYAIPIVVVLSFFMPDSFWDRMETIYYNDEMAEAGIKRERSADQRLKIWKVGEAVFWDHPLLGVGRWNFGLIHQRYAAPIWYGKIDDVLYADLFLRYRVCHNMYLDMLVSGGLITFLPWFLLILSVFRSTSRGRMALGDVGMDRYWKAQTYAIEIGIAGYLTTAFFQDLGEVEAFYWMIVLSGILSTILRSSSRADASARDDAPARAGENAPPLRAYASLRSFTSMAEPAVVSRGDYHAPAQSLSYPFRPRYRGH